MSKFIELISYEDANKVFINIDEIEVVSEYEGVTVVKLSKRQKGFLVRESYEQVKHLIETGEPLDNGDIAENKTIDTKQAIEWLKQFDENQRFQLMEGIDNGVDVSLYAKLEFDWEQMDEIRLGQQYGVDVTLYLDPNIPWEEMEKIRERLEHEKKGDTK